MCCCWEGPAATLRFLFIFYIIIGLIWATFSLLLPPLPLLLDTSHHFGPLCQTIDGNLDKIHKKKTQHKVFLGLINTLPARLPPSIPPSFDTFHSAVAVRSRQLRPQIHRGKSACRRPSVALSPFSIPPHT